MQKKVAFQLGVIGVAVFALVLMSIPLFRGARSAGKPMASQIKPGPSPKAGPAKRDSLVPAIKLRSIKDDKFYERLSRVAEALPIDRDPFSFADTGPQSSRESLELTGILWDDQKPKVIINQEFFSAGDSNDRFSVIKVLRDKVILKDSAGEFELRLKQ